MSWETVSTSADPVVMVRVTSTVAGTPVTACTCAGYEIGVVVPGSAMLTSSVPLTCRTPSESTNCTIRSEPAPVPMLRYVTVPSGR